MQSGAAHGRCAEQRAPLSWIDDKAHAELARVREAREKQVYPYFREFETGGLHTTIAGKPDHQLQLERLPRAHEPPEGEGGRAQTAVDKYACGLSSSRVQATTVEHVALEKRLAQVVRASRSACMFTTGYQAMLGTIVVARRQGHDARPRRYSHACILDGTFLAAGVPGTRARGPLLQPQLGQEPRAHPEDARAQERARPLRGRLLARRRHGATSRSSSRSATRYDAVARRRRRARHGHARRARHAASLEAMGLEGKVPDRRLDVLEDVRRHRRASSSAPSEVVELHPAHRALVPLQRVAARPHRRRRVDHPRHARGGRPDARRASCTRRPTTSAAKLTEAGFDLGASNTHIMPVMCRDERKTLFMHVALLECGVLMVPITYPAREERRRAPARERDARPHAGGHGHGARAPQGVRRGVLRPLGRGHRRRSRCDSPAATDALRKHGFRNRIAAWSGLGRLSGRAAVAVVGAFADRLCGPNVGPRRVRLECRVRLDVRRVHPETEDGARRRCAAAQGDAADATMADDQGEGTPDAPLDAGDSAATTAARCRTRQATMPRPNGRRRDARPDGSGV